MSPHKIKMIGISGPTCSGKSTICEKICKKIDSLHIKMDYFYKDRIYHPKVKNWHNHEVLDCYKLDVFLDALKKLKKGGDIETPVYKRSHGKQIRTEQKVARPIILVDGMLTFVDKEINKLFDYRIFLDISEKEQLRRRLEREPDLDLGYFHQVITPMYEKYKDNILKKVDVVVDANRPKNEVEKEVFGLVIGFINQS